MELLLTKAQPIEVAACTLNRFLHIYVEIAFAAETAFGSVWVRVGALELVAELLHDFLDAVAMRNTLAGPNSCLFQGLEVSPQYFFLVLAVVFVVLKHPLHRCVEVSVQDGAEAAASCVELLCMRCQ